MSKERDDYLESSIIKAKKYCDFCMNTNDPDSKLILMKEAVEALLEIANNPAEYYVAAKSEHSTFLLGVSEKEFTEKSRKILERISEDNIREFCRNYFDFVDSCNSECKGARKSIDYLYKEIVELVQEKSEEIASTIKEIKESDEKLERVLEVQTSQIKYLQTLIRKPGLP
jgi:intein-encoded DNA endonuclease-like protein